MPALELDNVCLSYGSHRAVDRLSLRLDRGRIGCLLGPSGCGKTSVLRCIAGFEQIELGEIRLAGAVVSSLLRYVPPEARSVGMVFQDYALFPHLTVEHNVGFGLHRLARSARCRRIDELLAITGLDSVRRSYPHEISGGQQQRVALARALSNDPAIVLADEPTGNLDSHSGSLVLDLLYRSCKEMGKTLLLATHDRAVVERADRIVELQDGAVASISSV